MTLFRSIKRTFFLALLIGLSACAIEDELSPTPDQVFVKYFGESGAQQLVDMIIEPDSGNVVILGKQTITEFESDGNIYLIKADTNGNQYNSAVFSMNELIYPDSMSYRTEDIPTAIIREATSGYIVTGSFNEIIDAQLEDSYLFWLYLNDQLVLQKWDTIKTPSGVFQSADIIQTSDRNVVLLGSTTDRAVNDLTTNAGSQYFLIKRDFNADTTIFRKTYGYANSNEYGSSVFETPEGNLTIIGQTDRLGSAGGGTGTNISVMILNPLATAQLSAKEYGLSINGTNTSDDTPVDAIQNSSGYVVVGTSTLGNSQQAFVMGLSNSGGLIFRNTLDSQWGINSTGASVAQTRENDLFVVGSYPNYSVNDVEVDVNSQNKNGEVMVMRTNPFGTPKAGLEANFGLVGGDDEANVVLRLASGSMLMGATIDFGSGQQMIALKKMNDQAILQRP